LYAVGATIAALDLKRGRYVLTPRFATAHIGFVPAIERPG
jgi:hypothetical protein